MNMLGLTVASAIAILQAVPQVVAALPEFKTLWDRIVDSFDGEATQADLQAAYEAAIAGAANQHQTFQDIVARHGGGG
jgi:hypothetical protein